MDPIKAWALIGLVGALLALIAELDAWTWEPAK